MFGLLSKHWKGLASAALALLISVRGGYIVARIQGIPPATILHFLWIPFAKAWSALTWGFRWLLAPASTTRLSSILLALGAFSAGIVLTHRVRRARVAESKPKDCSVAEQWFGRDPEFLWEQTRRNPRVARLR